MAISPAMAAAASPLVDDFAAGATGPSTVVDPSGSVKLGRLMKTEGFDGSALPAGWAITSWDAPPTGTATVAGGTLTANGARVTASRSYAAGQVLQFRATFGEATYQHLGFGNLTDGTADASTFADGPWAMFSTRDTAGTVLWARTLSGPTAQGGVVTETQLAADPKLPHDYRIEWSATEVTYFVDGAPVAVATHPLAAPIATQMRPALSVSAAAGAALAVDSAGLVAYADSGTFTSRVSDAGDARAVWGKLTAATSPASGAGVAFATRSGNTPTPDATWSAYQPLGADNAIASPRGRYIQYQATLSTTDDRNTPSVDRVELSYAIDLTEPIDTTIPSAGGGGADAGHALAEGQGRTGVGARLEARRRHAGRHLPRRRGELQRQPAAEAQRQDSRAQARDHRRRRRR